MFVTASRWVRPKPGASFCLPAFRFKGSTGVESVTVFPSAGVCWPFADVAGVFGSLAAAVSARFSVCSSEKISSC